MKIEGETRFVVTKPVTELTGKPIDRALLQRIAEQTGGKYFPLAQSGDWLAAIHYKQQQFATALFRNFAEKSSTKKAMMMLDWTRRIELFPERPSSARSKVRTATPKVFGAVR